MGRKNRPGWDVHPGWHDTGIVGKKGEKEVLQSQAIRFPADSGLGVWS